MDWPKAKTKAQGQQWIEYSLQEGKVYHATALISHANKVMLKILQARLQQYMNRKLPDVQVEFRRRRRTRVQTTSISWVIEESKRIPEKCLLLLYWLCLSLWLLDHNKLWKILKETGIPDHLTCFLRNLYAGQEATVRTGHGTMDGFQIGKGARQGCILSPCLFNVYTEYIMQNARLDKAQAGIKIAGRSINNLRYADDTILMGRKQRGTKEPLDESERGEWKSWLKTQYSKK